MRARSNGWRRALAIGIAAFTCVCGATFARTSHAVATPKADDELALRVLSNAGPKARVAVEGAPRYRFQVLYSEVVAASGGSPAHLERHGFRADEEYFYPASSLKLGLAIAAYERLFELRKSGPLAGITRKSGIVFQPPSGPPSHARTTLEYELWRALIVSNNDAANHLLVFAGHRALHERLWSLGAPSVRVRAPFAGGARPPPAEVSPPIDVSLEGGRMATLPEQRSDLNLPETTAPGLVVGDARVEGGRRVSGGLSFAEKNAIRIVELQDLLVRVVRPDLLGSPRTPLLSDDDLAHLRETLRTLPSESGIPGFDRNVVADTNAKTFLAGIDRVLPRGAFEIYSKSGQAFGFTLDNAYVVEKPSGRAFFLTAVVYTNPNETLNDDDYAYDTLAKPLFADLGEAFSREAFGHAKP